MNHAMVDREAFDVMGLVVKVRRGTETPELFADVWSRIESRRGELDPIARSDKYYGVSFATGDPDTTDYLAGVMVSSDAEVLEGLEKRRVSTGRFAVFESSVEGIGACYRDIFTGWLPQAGVSFDPSIPVFEEYPGETPSEPVRIHIPVRDSEEAG